MIEVGDKIIIIESIFGEKEGCNSIEDFVGNIYEVTNVDSYGVLRIDINGTKWSIYEGEYKKFN